ncbi:MAG: PD-(D/E)XK nuclease domain-containing protein, partial [Desulfovibrio sp.]|nr:PD-(D/E)XK nuclease domain-containing protein [Desulfovibrio sp.]
FDTSGHEPERFYHGFILGLIVELKDRYIIKSNRESGDGRYDVTLFPRLAHDHGIVLEFKNFDPKKERKIEKTCTNALRQIKEKNYITELLDHNVDEGNIFVYGFAFNGKNVLICGGAYQKIDWDKIVSTK